MGIMSDKKKTVSLLLLISIVVAAFFWCLDPNVFAQEGAKYSRGKVNVSAGVYVRKGTSTSTPIVGTATRGQTFDIYEEKYTEDSNETDKVWLKTSLNGYIRSDLADINYVEKDATVKVYLNARKGPSVSFTAQFVYSPNQKIKVLSLTKNSKNENWYRVKVSENSHVFVLAKYIELNENNASGNSTDDNTGDDVKNDSDPTGVHAFVTKSAVKGNGSRINTYDNYSFSAKQKEPILSAENIYFTTEYFVSSGSASMENRWYQTKDGRFINGKDLKFMNYISGYGKITKDTVGLSGAGSGFNKISNLKKDSTVTVVSNAYDKDGNAWLKVYENGRYKYVRAENVVDVNAEKTKEPSAGTESSKTEDSKDSAKVESDKKTGTGEKSDSENESSKKDTEANKPDDKTKPEEKKEDTTGKGNETKTNTDSQDVKPSGLVASNASASGVVDVILGVYVRRGPSTSTSRVNSASKNTRLQIYSEKFTTPTSNNEENIWFDTSLGGYVRSDLIATSYRTYTGYTTEYLNMRTGAGLKFPVVKTLKKDSRINVVLKAYDAEGNLWYKIKEGNGFYYVYANYVSDTLGGTADENPTGNSNQNTGQMSSGSDSSTLRPLTSAEFENAMNEQGFPESYKPGLRMLHAKYPNWQFSARHINLDWNQALNRQISSSNLVYYSQPEGYKDVGIDSYNFEGGYYYAKDGTTFIKASPQAVAYYMDPRNFLDENGVFMFEDLHYNPKFQTSQVVRDVLNSTSMPSGAERYFVEAGSAYNVSPVYMACKVVSEIGRSNSNIDGHSFTYGGRNYSGAYNPFNIGASDSAYGNPALKGLVWAISGNSYLRPWNTLEKSIKGGAMFIAKDFIGNNQHSMYYERFNVNNGFYAVGTHQYMTAVYGPANQAQSQFRGYSNLGLLNKGFVFEIPVYKNMPSSISPVPLAGHNNAFLKSLSISSGKTSIGMNSNFNKFTNNYVAVGNLGGVNQISINAIPYRNDVRVTYNGGPGNKIVLKNGKNVVKIDVTSPSGRTIQYVVTINK